MIFGFGFWRLGFWGWTQSFGGYWVIGLQWGTELNQTNKCEAWERFFCLGFGKFLLQGGVAKLNQGSDKKLIHIIECMHLQVAIYLIRNLGPFCNLCKLLNYLLKDIQNRSWITNYWMAQTWFGGEKPKIFLTINCSNATVIYGSAHKVSL